ncbi:MAG: hypothetical protein M3143_03570 [Actinomycetota bacterium]|nr:hypothetical protein [Actinomycetota bacterium]
MLRPEIFVPFTHDKRHFPGILLVITTAIQYGNGQRGLWIWPQLDGCVWRGITR